MPGFGRPSGPRHKWGGKQPTSGPFAPKTNEYAIPEWKDVYIYIAVPMVAKTGPGSVKIVEAPEEDDGTKWPSIKFGESRNFAWGAFAMGYQIDTKKEAWDLLKKLYAESKKAGNDKALIKVWSPYSELELGGDADVSFFGNKINNENLKKWKVLPPI